MLLEMLSPSSGGYDLLGSFRALIYTYRPGAVPPFYAVSGDSYIAAVDFSSPMRVKVLLTYGNASQPDSPHNGDQLMLYAKDQLRSAPLLTSAQNSGKIHKDRPWCIYWFSDILSLEQSDLYLSHSCIENE